MNASWYGKTTSKQLDSLLDTKPKLTQLFALTEFFQEIKSYNTKLLDYLSSNPHIINQMIVYLTNSPSPQDSQQRKYKWPLQSMQLIQTQTTCILNGFFKQTNDNTNFDSLFHHLQNKQILPLLAGYFFRTTLCLLNNKYKEAVDRVYTKPKMLFNLINHSNHMAISNTIQLFLNLDINKNSTSLQDRLNIKLDILRAIIKKIDFQSKVAGPESTSIIQNLSSVLVQTVDKYYLILDGKQMVEVITDQPTIDIMMRLIKQNSQNSFAAFCFFISLINYFSFSSFNTDQAASSQVIRKNMEKLENQPMILEIVKLLPEAIRKISNVNKIDLYHYKLLEVLCHCISISSMRIFKSIVDSSFFGHLIHLLFKHQQNNVLHMLIEKSFYHVFISQRKIYEQYKKHLFCDIDIIDITVNRVLKLFKQENFMNQIKKKPYFGHFMRILKIYSGVQPTQISIINAIKAKTQSWSKISQILIKPYEAICFKQLGSYSDIPTPVFQQFNIKKSNVIVSSSSNSSKTILQIQKQQHFPTNSQSLQKQQVSSSSHHYIFDQEPATIIVKPQPPVKKQQLKQQTKQMQLKKTQSFKQFMNKRKQQVGQDIKLRRSLSNQKKLSNNSRGKMTNPSPNKKNSWKQKQQNSTQNLSKTKNKQITSPTKDNSNLPPMMPHAKKSTTYQSERQNRFIGTNPSQNQRVISKSVNMEELRKIKIIQIDPPKERRYRRADEKDKILLDFLGIAI